MDPLGAARKRPFPDVPANGNGGVAGLKRSRPETESFASGIGSKSKPCTKFFSTSGCPFGEGCHFLHYVPGGLNAVAQITNLGNPAVPSAPRNPVGPPLTSDQMGLAVKTRMCNKFNTAEGCKFGDKCHFAHGERELGKPIVPLHHEERPMLPPMGNRMLPGLGRMEPPPPGLAAAASFGVSASTKISIDASLSGAIIGKGGANSKQIQRVTGAKLMIRDHESDANLRNIEFEGTFDQIKQATGMVRELISNVGSGVALGGMSGRNLGPVGGKPAAPNNYKTKLCENFTKGSCTFGERCHFAHGSGELRKSGGI